MNKGIIVVDMPQNCRDCNLRTANGYCMPGHKDIFLFGVKGEKPDWCPIKEIPTKLEELKQPHSIGDYQRKGFQRGWNACIDKILKE